ncbi:MAG: heme ABC exporter ATP-binding protein CcmA [Lachnospiraceae bacterium]
MLEVSEVQKKYGKKCILENIAFQISPGEQVAIVGKNGCGKSTLMRILAGILKPDAGTIRYFGQDALKNTGIFRKYCGYVPQENPLMEELSVKDNLKLWGSWKDEHTRELLELFQLEEMLKIPVEKLSGGMKRRVSIVCAMINRPPVMLMDEPTTALDLYYKDSIRKWMKQYKDQNGIVLITTHDEQEIMECDRCFVMRNGNVRELPQGEERLLLVKKYITE